MKNVTLQLYSVNDYLQDDFYGTLKRVAELGYRYVEFAGYKGNDVNTLKIWLQELGLKAVSNHCNIENMDEEITFAKELGMKNLACPAAWQSHLADVKLWAEDYTKIGKKCAENGIAFSYHNHAFEFEKRDGEYLLDSLFQNTDPSLVNVQPDFFWIAYAGEDPVKYAEKYKDRMPTVHCKEISDLENKLCVAVGDGIVDFAKIYDILGDDRYYIVELEDLGDSVWEAAQRSLDYLAALS